MSEKRYARFSLRTVNVATAVDRAKVHYHQLIYLVKPTSPKQLKRALKII